MYKKSLNTDKAQNLQFIYIDMYLHHPEEMMFLGVPGPELDRAHRNHMFVSLDECADRV